jgi:hypothetical protein
MRTQVPLDRLHEQIQNLPVDERKNIGHKQDSKHSPGAVMPSSCREIAHPVVFISPTRWL